MPVIYSTDLSHPHVDPDDHFDLAAVLTEAAGRAIVERGGELLPVIQDEILDSDRRVQAFRFLPISLFVDENTRVLYEKSARSLLIYRYEISSADRYAEIMSSVTRFLIKNIKIVER